MLAAKEDLRRLCVLCVQQQHEAARAIERGSDTDSYHYELIKVCSARCCSATAS